METTTEDLIRRHRKEIVRCIKEPTVVTILEVAHISSEDAKLLREGCQQRSPGWVDKLLDIVLASQEQGHLTAFLDALTKAGYPYLVKLLKQELPGPEEIFFKRIGIHRPDIDARLSVQVYNIAVKLEKYHVLNLVDRQEIESYEANKGSVLAIGLLLDRMQCRLSPREWYYSFCKALLKLNRADVLKIIDPDFLDNPSCCLPGKASDNSDTEMEVSCEDAAMCTSVQEHIMTDHVEAHVSVNNLSKAPSQSETETTSTNPSFPADEKDPEHKLSQDENNLCSLNIKPDISKPLLDGDPSLTGVKIEGQDQNAIHVKQEVKEEPVDSENEASDGNPFDSDYEDEDRTMFELRDYQTELAEAAVAGKNTVVCAPTGVGKTWVALHIINEHLKADATRRVVFMAKTGALIKQQADRIKQYLPQYETKLLQGDADNTQMLGEYLQDYQIFCFTPQVLVNNLENRSIASISRLSLIILDECHHTKGDSPYSNLMRRYLAEKFDPAQKGRLPQIVGLTATLGVGKSSTDTDALDYILRVCALLDVRDLSTVKRCSEAMYKETSKPDEEVIRIQQREDDPGMEILKSAIFQTERMLEDMALLQPDLIDLMHEKCPPNKEGEEYNKWTHEVMKLVYLRVEDYNTSRNIYSCASYLNVYNQALEVNSLLQTGDVIKFLAQHHQREAEQQNKLTDVEKKLLSNLLDVQRKLNRETRDIENPNIRTLSGKLRSMLETSGEDSRAMVFVKARATCKALAKFLDRDLGDIVRTSPLYGKENRGHDEGMTQAVQDETVQRFRDGDYKVIVATSIGVEGIDIPDCNMALNYNYIGNEITKVQMRGRIRKHGGRNITMVHAKDLDKERLSAYKEAMMLRAMNKFDKLSLQQIDRKVVLYQKEEMQMTRFKHEVEMAKKRRKTDEGDFEFRCRRCNTVACYISDVRTIKVQHFVIDKDFEKKIIEKPHKSPKVFDGFNKNRKMFCKKCPLDWGIVALKDGLDCRILKLESFKVRNMVTNEIRTYKKWIDIPYKVKEIEVEDLPKLLGDNTE